MATKGNIIVVLVAISACCRVASSGSSPGLGTPPGCLISRIEFVRCPSVSGGPGANQFQVLTTEFDCSTPFPTCTANMTRRTRDIDVSGITNQVFSIHSPGFNGRNTYLADALARYNIQCGGNRLAYLNVNQINMEGKTCFDPNRDANVCVDYFRVNRPGLHFTESCGTDASENSDELEIGSFEAIFRSSPEPEDSRTPGGFEGTVVCFDQGQANTVNCEPVVTDAETALQRRKKRTSNYYLTRPFLPQTVWKEFSVENLSEKGFAAVRVPHGASATFLHGVIRFTDNLNDRLPLTGLPKIPDIKFFKDFDGLSRPRTFIRSALTRGRRLLRFPGPGLLFHKRGIAIFLRFVINPKGLQPTEEERAVILQLTGAIQDAFRLRGDNDTDIFPTTEPPTIMTRPLPTKPIPTRPLPTKPTTPRNPRYWFTYDRRRKQRDTDDISSNQESHLRQKRQAEILIFTEQQFDLACANRMACNPILRASANSVIESSGRECPTSPVVLF